MDTLVEELQLLGLWNEPIKTENIEFMSQFSNAIRGLLDLYHSTFKEKSDLQELFARQMADIKELREANFQLQVDCSKQDTLISNLKLREENLLARVEANSQEQERLRKKGLEERLKWQRLFQLERLTLQKAHKEASSLKDELRKIMSATSSKKKKNGELMEGPSIQILNNHLKTELEFNKKKTSLKEEVLGKSIRRLGESHRALVEESASIYSVLQAVNSSIQQSISALRIYVVQEGKPVTWDSSTFKNDVRDDKTEAPTYLPVLVTNTHQMCAELNELVETLLNSSNCNADGVSGEAVRNFIHSFSNYENILDSAIKSICLK